MGPHLRLSTLSDHREEGASQKKIRRLSFRDGGGKAQLFYPQGLQSLNLKSCCFPREKRIDHYSLDPSFKKSAGKGLILFSLIQLALARVVVIQLAPSQSHDSSSSHQPWPRIWGHTRIWLLYTLWGDFLEKGVPSRPWPLHRVNSEYSGDLEEKNQAWSKSGKLGAGGSGELPRQTARKAPSGSQRSLLWWTLWGSHLTLAPHSTGYTPSPMFSTPRILHKKKREMTMCLDGKSQTGGLPWQFSG